MSGAWEGGHLDSSWKPLRELGGLSERNPGVAFAPTDVHRATGLIETGGHRSGVVRAQLRDLTVEGALPAGGGPWSSELVDPRGVEAVSCCAGDVLTDESGVQVGGQ